MSTACIIPVRGGSKGIRRKNLSPIYGKKTLLERTLDQALRCFAVSEVLVSTEDAEMAEIAKACGATIVPRPVELANDQSTTASVVDHLLRTLDPHSETYDQVVILQVTSPLRDDDDISEARKLINSGQFDSVVSCVKLTAHHPAKMYYIDGHTAQPVCPEFESARRQDLPEVYHRNGAIFWTTRHWFNATGRLWGGQMGLVMMPEVRSIDIDTSIDLDRAREILSAGMHDYKENNNED